jgi:hypothetical protein
VWADAALCAGLSDPLVVYAIALMESGAPVGRDGIAPWPWTLSFGGHDVRAASRADAEKILATVDGRSNVDIGLMQVNLAAHHRMAASATDILEPRENVRIGGLLLREALRSAPGDLVLGVGRYHSWNDDRARWYGAAVWRLYLSLAKLSPTRGLG